MALKEVDPRQLMWTAVLLQAIRDANNGARHGVAGVERKEAEAFLSGGEDLDTVCDLIGINAEEISAAFHRGELKVPPKTQLNYVNVNNGSRLQATG